MEQETVHVQERTSARVTLGQLILSARETYFDRIRIVVGRPGLPNVERELYLGDAVLFETPDDGLLEVRIVATGTSGAEILVSQVSPRQGIAGGLVEADPSNLPFTPEELKRIRESLATIGLQMSQRADVPPEQLDLISRKLSEIQSASERLGRKDWILLTAGTLTNLIVAAAFSPLVARALLDAANSSFQWLFAGALRLLQ